MGEFPSKSFDSWVTQTPEEGKYCDDCGEELDDCECED